LLHSIEDLSVEAGKRHRRMTAMCNLYLQRQQGFSLVELSIATAIYSMGLGSLALMMLLAVQGTVESRLQTVASIETASMAEMILMTSDAIGHYANPAGNNAAACGIDQACAPEQMAEWQLQRWRARLAAELPDGRGLVCQDRTPQDGDADNDSCDGVGASVIKVFWRLPADADEPDSLPSRQVLQLP